MPLDSPYTIADLARLTGLNVRTIRYYLAQGLLPASGESGPGAHYGEGHLDRLRLTKRLQVQHLPLAEIRRRLAELTDADVSTLLATASEPEAAPSTSALEYVRGLLGASIAERPISMPIAAYGPPVATPPPTTQTPTTQTGTTEPQAADVPAATTAPAGARSLLARARYAPIGMVSRSRRSEPAADTEGQAALEAPAAVTAMAGTRDVEAPAPQPPALEPPAKQPSQHTATEPAGPERSQWERLALGPNVELHIRRPLSRLEQRRVERLITIARQVLDEDQS